MAAYLRSYGEFSAAVRERRRAELSIADTDGGGEQSVQQPTRHRPFGWEDIAAAYWPGVLQARQAVVGGERRDCRDGMPVDLGLEPNFTGMSLFDVC